MRANLIEGVDFNGGLSDAGECPLGTLAGRPETPESTGVIGDVELGLLLELILEVLKEGVVKVLTTKVSITSSSLHGEDTAANVEERNIEGSSSKIENKDVLLGLGLAVETVGNGSSSRLVDDTENIKAGDSASIFGSKTLRVIEVGRNTK